MQVKKRIIGIITVMVICLSTLISATGCMEKQPFTVWFESNGGTLVSGKVTQQVTSASDIVAPVFEREHYEFLGWDVKLDSINKHTTVSAKWGERYFLSFDSGVEDVFAVRPDQPIGELPKPVNEKNSGFAYWAVDSQRITDTTPWTWKDDKQAKAVWFAEGEYGIELFYNGGSVANENPLKYSKNGVTIILNNPTREGYEFLGWDDVNTVEEELMLNVEIPSGSTGNKCYDAKWKANQYNISFNARSGDVESDALTVTYDQPFGELPVPTNGNVKFLGWFFNDEKLSNGDLYRYAQDVELVAKWEYTITFQLWSQVNNDKKVEVDIIGDDPKDIVVDSDYVVNTNLIPADLVRLLNVDTAVYHFYGWTFNNKKFDGTDYAYPADTTVEQLMLSLKESKTWSERQLRKEIIEKGGIVTIVARSRSIWSGSH
jgi:uncharacterized repeat protein (TIGR02543 family)